METFPLPEHYPKFFTKKQRVIFISAALLVLCGKQCFNNRETTQTRSLKEIQCENFPVLRETTDICDGYIYWIFSVHPWHF